MLGFIKRKRWLIIIFALILIIGGFGYYRIKSRKFEVETAKVTRGDLIESISIAGEVKSHNQVDLAFQSAGIVSWLPVKVGDKVKAWQSLASLDTRILQASFEKARADWVSTSHTLKETEETYRGSWDVITAEGEVTKAKAAVDAYWNLLQIADRNLKNAVLVTPIEGTVVQVNIKKGEYGSLTTGTAVVVADPNDLYIKAEVDESDFGKISLGQKAAVSLDAFPDNSLEGKIIEISPSVTTNSAGDKVVEIKIDFANAQPQNLLVGMTGDVNIITEEVKDILLIPVEAVFVKNDKDHVFKIVDSQAILTEIQTGLENDEHIEVISGLVEGDVVVIEKTDQIKENMVVKVD